MEDYDVFTNEIDFTKPVYTHLLKKFVKDIPVTPNGPNYQSEYLLIIVVYFWIEKYNVYLLRYLFNCSHAPILD